MTRPVEPFNQHPVRFLSDVRLPDGEDRLRADQPGLRVQKSCSRIA